MRRAFGLPVPARALSLGLVVAMVALSGCLGGGGGDVTPARGDCPDPGPGVLDLHILPGAWSSASTAWYEPANPSLEGIHTVCWVNDDEYDHIIIATVGNIDTTPSWVLDAIAIGEAPLDPHAGHAGHDDSGGAHDHGSMPLTFNITIGPGGYLALPVTPDMAGRLDVHCHPHPWMVATWDVLPADPIDHPVEVGNVAYVGDHSNEAVAVNESATVNWELTAPNLKRIKAIVDWVDNESVNDIEQSNQADTLKVDLVDPSGAVVATKPASSTSPIRLDFTVDSAWPETIAGLSQTSAAANLSQERPDDTTYVGTWSVVVTVVSAPGPIPDSNGQTGPIQGLTDGEQSFHVSFEAVHEYGKVLAPKTATMDGMVASIVTLTAA